MKKHTKRSSLMKPLWLVGGVLVGLFLFCLVFLRDKNIAMLNSKGFIAHEQVWLMTFSIILLLAIALPVVVFLYFTAWKYRESNEKATHRPNARYGRWLDVGMWIVPSMFMAVLAVVMWGSTHRLEPQKQIENGTKPITIQVVSMRWKWLFIYPEQHIATVNHVQIPVHTPVRFELTADEAPMSSFWIPNLGGQLYTMTGMVNKLNLIADTTGDYPGSSAEINGKGFSEMKFVARVSTEKEFQNWVDEVRTSPDNLDDKTYQDLIKPGLVEKRYYGFADTGLYSTIIKKYTGHSGHTEGDTSHEAGH